MNKYIKQKQTIVFSAFLISLISFSFGSNAYAVDENALMELYKRLQSLGKEIDELRGENEVLKYQLKSVTQNQKKGFIAIDDRIESIKKSAVAQRSTPVVVAPRRQPAKPTVIKPVMTAEQRKAQAQRLQAQKKAKEAQLKAQALQKAKAASIAKKQAELKKMYQKRHLAMQRQQQWDAKQKAAIAKKQAELKALREGKAAPAKKQVSAKRQAPAKKPLTATKAQANSQTAKVAERKMYYGAYNILKSNKYEAIKAFDAFQKKYPNSQFLEEAYFWKGESYYMLKNYKAAINEYVYVLNKYKLGKRAPDAAVKLGYSLYNLGDYDLAKQTLGDVVKFFPSSKAATLASKRLAEMKKSGK